MGATEFFRTDEIVNAIATREFRELLTVATSGSVGFWLAQANGFFGGAPGRQSRRGDALIPGDCARVAAGLLMLVHASRRMLLIARQLAGLMVPIKIVELEVGFRIVECTLVKVCTK